MKSPTITRRARGYLVIFVAALFTLTTSRTSHAQELRALPVDRCRDYASIGYGCCLFVYGYRDGNYCAARFLGPAQSRATETAVSGAVAVYVRLLIGANVTLAGLTVPSMIALLATQRLDLTGTQSLATAAVARCMAGEHTVPYRREQANGRIGIGGYTHPLIGGQLWDRRGVEAFIASEREACSRQVAERALAEIRRPRALGQWCGVRVAYQPPRPRLGDFPPLHEYVRNAHYCAAPNNLCCWESNFWGRQNAYCLENPVRANRGRTVCTDASPPAP